MDTLFIDTNIFMYAIGADHPYKIPCQKIIQSIIVGDLKGVINTEVLQEILYRYTAINTEKVAFELFDTMVKTFSMVWPVSKEDLMVARKLQEKYGVKTRDCIHAATMQHHGVRHLYTYDRDFERLPGITRMDPLEAV